MWKFWNIQVLHLQLFLFVWWPLCEKFDVSESYNFVCQCGAKCSADIFYLMKKKKQLNPVWAAFFWKLVLDMIDFNLIWYGHVKYCRYPKKVFWSTRSSAGPRLHCLAKLQFGRVHFGVFSRSCFLPPALSSDWTSPALSSVIQLTGSVDVSSLVEGSNWLEVLNFRHSQGVQTDWKCWFFITHRGFQLTRSVEFLSFTGGSNSLEVLIFCHSQEVPTYSKCWFFVTHRGFQLNRSVNFSSLTGGSKWLEVLIFRQSRWVPNGLLDI